LSLTDSSKPKSRLSLIAAKLRNLFLGFAEFFIFVLIYASILLADSQRAPFSLACFAFVAVVVLYLDFVSSLTQSL
jgi:hypothetical protein